MDTLLSLDWDQTLTRLQDLIRNPQSNVVASVLLLAAFSIVVLLIMLTVGMFLLGGGDDDDEWEEDEWEAEQAPRPDTGAEGMESSQAAPIAAEEDVRSKRPLIIRLGVLVGVSAAVSLAVWMLAGFTTSQTSVCLSCHSGSVHSKSDADPHQSVRCVACHEQGGILGSLTSAVPRRAAHFATGILSAGPRVSYGSTSSGACLGCHRGAVRATVVVQDRGIRISHREPLDAGAECLDCHALADGAVSNRTTGMAPCLRCHDGTTASTECEICHTRPMGTAAEPAQSASKQALDRIGQPDCGTCHDQTTCDACHGIRMPHTKAFMAYGHARAGVEDFWDNGGAGCAKCHTSTRRPCGGCHLNAFGGHPVKEWRKSHGAGGANNSTCLCHDRMAYIKGRNFCSLCHEVTQKDGVWQLAPE